MIVDAVCSIRSMPTLSNSPKMPVLGKPAGAPIAASACSTGMPCRTASSSPRIIQ